MFHQARSSGKLNFEIGDEEYAQSQSSDSFAHDLMKKLFHGSCDDQVSKRTHVQNASICDGKSH